MTTEQFVIDPSHQSFDFFGAPISKDVWADKYRFVAGGEASVHDTFKRVSQVTFQREPHLIDPCNEAMSKGLLMPAGRILAGCGTDKVVTLMNCYVMGDIPDTLEGIFEHLKQAALTLQQGGGIGYNFSTLRPNGAVLRRTGEGSAASGPLPFMDTWDAMCRTIMSAGARRGAMMAVMADWHPDVLDFISAKRQKGRLEMFNVSVLISDRFMEAKENGEWWYLHSDVPPTFERPNELECQDFKGPDGKKRYVYKAILAQEMWDLITRYTYNHSEPGVIFIDRVNQLNNLKYCENIRATNPCGEQPLPPYGACNLGHVVLARMVFKPFTSIAYFDFDLLRKVVRLAVRFLDNVIDISKYPLPQQLQEQKDKRRIGLGYAGLADAFAQMGIRYGSPEAVSLTDTIGQVMKETAYEESCAIAEEKGSFPLFDDSEYLKDGTFASTLHSSIQGAISRSGIRNSLLLTIAPTGTTSCVYGNISGGVEPTFAHLQDRRVLQRDGSYKTHIEESFTRRFYRHFYQIEREDEVNLPDWCVTTRDLFPMHHLEILATAQKHVDASVSKTINCPKDIPFEVFQDVYQQAYNLGCKSCTTYRPSESRGYILRDAEEGEEEEEENVDSESVVRSGNMDADVTVDADDDDVDEPEQSKRSDDLPSRPEVLDGVTHQVKWPGIESAVYITINYYLGRPWEIFIASKDARNQEWMIALSIMVSSVLKRARDPSFVADELKNIQSPSTSGWYRKRYYGSIVAYIGEILDRHFGASDMDAVMHAIEAPTHIEEVTSLPPDPFAEDSTIEHCPRCNAPALVTQEGCKQCNNCGYSNCG